MDKSELDDFVERVREGSDIFSVVSRYVPLTLKGGKYWACCPFHNEKTASFSITPDKGLFYCFGCHEGGNVFHFISKIEHVTYFEAVKLQAERLGISLPSRKKSPEELARDREENIFRKINELAKNFYRECLTKTAEGEAGRKYLNSRGISNETIENFQIGFAPNSWDSLTKEFTRRGFSPEQLVSAGLVSPRKNGGGFYDRMRGRVIIPIADIFGHVIGFGGRILDSESEKDSPKYLNSPETILFNKRKVLFGLDKAHRAISAANCAIVVEGYMDAISLVSAGIKNVVATLGTAFTAEHAKLILRYARRMIFCYDSDEAGKRATLRALSVVQNTGLEVSVINIPDGKDPDDFIRKHGKKAFEELAKNSLGTVEYLLKNVLETADYSTLGGKIDALKKILPVLAEVKDLTARSEYLKKISSALILDENVILEEWKSFSARLRTENPGSQTVSKVQPTSRRREKTSPLQEASEVILRMAWYEGDTLGYVLTLVPREIFSEVHREIIFYLEKCFAEDRRPNDLTAAEELSAEANSELSRILVSGTTEPRSTELAAFEDSVRTLRLMRLKKLYAETLREAENFISSGDPSYVEKMRESLKIKKEMDEL